MTGRRLHSRDMSAADEQGDGKRAPAMTLRDVATRAGVSTSTVARVVHGKGYVSEKTRARVETVMREGGFRLNAVASGLKRQRTTTIGTLLHETLPNPFFAEVALGIEKCASDHGYNVLVYNARGSAEIERAGVDVLLSQQVDAIVFAKPVEASNVELAHRAGAAVVEVEKPRYGALGSVLVDNYVGATAAMRHLLELGHLNIGFIGEPSREDSTATGRWAARVINERLAGYRDALAERGLPEDDSLIVVGEYYRDAGWPSLRTGYDYMTTLLRQHPSVTAVLAGSDLLAAGALQALYERGIRVPDELSVIGFDDTYAKHLAPPLTTVRQPMFRMGTEAAALAMELAAGERPRKREVWLQTELVVRGSTAPPRRG